MYLTAFRDFEQRDGDGVYLGWSMALGESVQLHSEYASADERTGVTLTRRSPYSGGWDWMLRGSRADDSLLQAGSRYTGNYGAIGVDFARDAGQERWQLGGRGSFVLADRRLIAGRYVQDEFALVSTNGLAGVPVLHESRPVGRTNADGLPLLPNVNAYQPNLVAIDPLAIPFGYVLDHPDCTATPRISAGTAVRFPIERPRDLLMRSWILRACVIVLWWLGSAPTADALTCTITASDVAFGSIDPLAGTEVDVSANIQIDCSEIVPALLDPTVGVCIYLDEGDGGSDGSVFRHMRQGSDILPYNLYKDAARTTIWGSDTAFPASGAQRVIVTLAGLLPSTGSLTVPVYGRVPAAVSDRPVGAYLSTFAGGARARYSFSDTIACDGVAGTQASDTFIVTGSIAETCTVEADDLAFGTEAQLDVDVDSSSQVRTSCSTGLAYSVALGTGGGGAFAARRMEHESLPAEIVG